MDFLWEHPAHFADGDLTEVWKDDALLTVFELGVLFGIAYERAYPSNARDR